VSISRGNTVVDQALVHPPIREVAISILCGYAPAASGVFWYGFLSPLTRLRGWVIQARTQCQGDAETGEDQSGGVGYRCLEAGHNCQSTVGVNHPVLRGEAHRSRGGG